MKKFIVSCEVKILMDVIITAESLEDAVRKGRIDTSEAVRKVVEKSLPPGVPRYLPAFYDWHDITVEDPHSVREL